jgi:hypothetical protein
MTRITSTLNEGLYTFVIITPTMVLKMRNISGKVLRKSKHRSCVQYFFFVNRTVYEIMWDNTIQPDRPHIKIYGACALHAGYLRLQTYSEY